MGVDLVENILPICFYVGRLREQARHADDGYWLARFWPAHCRRCWPLVRISVLPGAPITASIRLRLVCAALRSCRPDRAWQRFVRSCTCLQTTADLRELEPMRSFLLDDRRAGKLCHHRLAIQFAAARQTFAGDTQATQIHQLQLFAHLIARDFFCKHQPGCADRRKCVYREIECSEWRDRDRSPAKPFDSHLIAASWNFLDDGAGVHRFLGEEVAVPIRAPTLTPRAASGAANAETMAAGEMIVHASGKQNVKCAGVGLWHRWTKAACRPSLPTARNSIGDRRVHRTLCPRK